MSDLFNYLYYMRNEYDNKKYNTLCNRLYGVCLSICTFSIKLDDIGYKKRVFYEKELSSVTFCVNMNNYIKILSCKKNNITNTYYHIKKSIYVLSIYRTNYGNYDYINMHFNNHDIMYGEKSYNVKFHSSISNRSFLINTETKQYKIVE